MTVDIKTRYGDEHISEHEDMLRIALNTAQSFDNVFLFKRVLDDYQAFLGKKVPFLQSLATSQDGGSTLSSYCYPGNFDMAPSCTAYLMHAYRDEIREATDMPLVFKFAPLFRSPSMGFLLASEPILAVAEQRIPAGLADKSKPGRYSGAITQVEVDNYYHCKARMPAFKGFFEQTERDLEALQQTSTTLKIAEDKIDNLMAQVDVHYRRGDCWLDEVLNNDNEIYQSNDEDEVRRAGHYHYRKAAVHYTQACKLLSAMNPAEMTGEQKKQGERYYDLLARKILPRSKEEAQALGPKKVPYYTIELKLFFSYLGRVPNQERKELLTRGYFYSELTPPVAGHEKYEQAWREHLAAEMAPPLPECELKLKSKSKSKVITPPPSTLESFLQSGQQFFTNLQRAAGSCLPAAPKPVDKTPPSKKTDVELEVKTQGPHLH